MFHFLHWLGLHSPRCSRSYGSDIPTSNTGGSSYMGNSDWHRDSGWYKREMQGYKYLSHWQAIVAITDVWYSINTVSCSSLCRQEAHCYVIHLERDMVLTVPQFSIRLTHSGH